MTDPFVNEQGHYRHGPDDYGLTQQGRRTTYQPLDQHRRKWSVSIELTRRGPSIAGAIIPCFDDPLRTPMQYISMVPNRLDLLWIDYDRWAGDQEAAVAEWTAHKDEYGREMYGDHYDPEKKLEELPGRGRELARLIGKEPLSPEVVRRAQAGEKALLKGENPVRKPAKAATKPTRTPRPTGAVGGTTKGIPQPAEE